MYFNIGNVIRILRKHKKMTQEILAMDICSIKQLSRIESNKSIPTSLLLKEFSYKLGEDISNYFSYLDKENPVESKERIDYLEKSLLSSEYEICFDLAMEYIRSDYNIDTLYHRQLLWYKHTAALQVNDILDPSCDDFFDLLMIKKEKPCLDQLFCSFIKPFDYQVISSIILIYLKNEDYNSAKYYLKKTIESFEKSYIASNDFSYLKALYNISRVYYFIDKNYELSLLYSSKGLDSCIMNKTIYYLDDFCLLKGKSLYNLGRIEEGREFIKTFICLSKLIDNHKNLDRIIENLKKLYNV